MVDDTTVTYTSNTVRAPLVVATVFNGTTISAIGQSEPIYIGGSIHLLLIVTLGTEVGNGSVKFHIKPCTSDGTLIGAYDNATAELTSAQTVGLAIDETSTTPLGEHVEISWSTAGTLDIDNKFTLSTVKIVAK